MPKETCCQSFVRFLVLYVLLPVLLPFLFLIAPFYRAWGKYTFEWFQDRNVCTAAEHRQKVERVQQQVKAWNRAGRKSRMCTARPEWASFSVHHASKRNLSQIEVDHLHHVAEIDEANRLVTVEPGLRMGQLTAILLKRGWTIPVIPEFETLSVGGVICGTGVESNSTRYGLSGDCAVEFEVVLSNGDVVNCSKSNHPELFHSIPWSHGTLGFLVGVKYPLIPAKKYIQLEYFPTESYAEAKNLLESEDHEFVEGFAFGRHKFVVTHGDLTDHVDSRLGSVNNVNRWYKAFFYKHAESFLGRARPAGGKKQGKRFVEYIPLRDYYHRHTRAYFWEIPVVFWFSPSRLFLALFGWIFPGQDAKVGFRVAFGISHDFANYAYNLFYSFNHVLQDFIVPLKDLEAALDLLQENVEIYPLWLCPCKVFKKPGMFHTKDSETEMFVDIGVYGDVSKAKRLQFEQEATVRKIERFAIEHGGVQFMYADSFLSREEFEQMFDMELYDSVRAKYSCLDAFPHLYDKVSKHARGIQV